MTRGGLRNYGIPGFVRMAAVKKSPPKTQIQLSPLEDSASSYRAKTKRMTVSFFKSVSKLYFYPAIRLQAFHKLQGQ